MDITIPKLIGAWLASGAEHTAKPSATEREIRSAEARIGATLTDPLREVYILWNGGWMLELNFLALEPNPPEEPWGLTNETENFIEDEYRISRELRLFAGNGMESYFGIWLPESGNAIFNHPIVEVSLELNDVDGCMGIAGTNLVSFLHGWSAYYIQLVDGAGPESEQKALNMLGLPPHLWHDRFYATYFDTLVGVPSDSGIDHHFRQLRKWADPLLPDPYGDADNQQYSIADLKRIFG